MQFLLQMVKFRILMLLLELKILDLLVDLLDLPLEKRLSLELNML